MNATAIRSSHIIRILLQDFCEATLPSAAAQRVIVCFCRDGHSYLTLSMEAEALDNASTFPSSARFVEQTLVAITSQSSRQSTPPRGSALVSAVVHARSTITISACSLNSAFPIAPRR
jgi:hypothetical protein